MPVEFDGGSPGKFDSRTLNRKTLSRWTGRTQAQHPDSRAGLPQLEHAKAGPRHGTMLSLSLY